MPAMTLATAHLAARETPFSDRFNVPKGKGLEGFASHGRVTERETKKVGWGAAKSVRGRSVDSVPEMNEAAAGSST